MRLQTPEPSPLLRPKTVEGKRFSPAARGVTVAQKLVSSHLGASRCLNYNSHPLARLAGRERWGPWSDTPGRAGLLLQQYWCPRFKANPPEGGSSFGPKIRSKKEDKRCA